MVQSFASRLPYIRDIAWRRAGPLSMLTRLASSVDWLGCSIPRPTPLTKDLGTASLRSVELNGPRRKMVTACWSGWQTPHSYAPTHSQSFSRQMADEAVTNPNDPLRRGPYVDPAPGTQLHQTLQPVTGRVIAVGDVHGCFEELTDLLDECQVDPDNDAVIIVGDMVNKGPMSLEVVRYVRDNAHVHTVMGNHEGFALLHYDRLKRGEASVDELLDVVQWVADMTEEEADWIRALPYTLAVPQFGALIVHAGLIPDGRPLADQSLSLMYRVRNMLETSDADGRKTVIASEKPDIGSAWIDLWKGPEYVIFGHDAVRGLQQTDYAVGLDSGCCYGRQLSAMVLPERKLVQVDAKAVHSEPKIPSKPET